MIAAIKRANDLGTRSYGGRHPSRRGAWVEHEMKCWEPGARSEGLSVIASMRVEEFVVKIQAQR